MAYEFTIVRLKKNSEQSIAFPADLVALPRNPIAGPFEGSARDRVLAAIESFPNATKVSGIKNCFLIETPGGGSLEVWMAGDGHLFLESQAGLELLLELFLHLRLTCDDLVIEDVQRGLLHTRTSFAKWVQGAGQESAAA